MNEKNIRKNELRKKFIKIRNDIKNKEEKSNIIFSKIIVNEIYKKSKVVALYKSFSSEVDTTKLIEHSINMEKIICLPKVFHDELKFYKINSLSERLIKSKFEVEEPIENEANYIEKNDIELVIVPGICFDKEKNRLGYGRGYYDRFLESKHLNTIAICFSEQILDSELLPITDNDIKVEQIITDKNTFF